MSRLANRKTPLISNQKRIATGLLLAEIVAADDRDHRAGPDKGIGRFGGVVIIDRAAGRVPAVDGVARRPARGVVGGHIPVAVTHSGEGAVLIDHPRDRVRKRGVAHAIEHHRANRHLAGVAFAPRLRGNQFGKQLNVRA